MGPSGWHGWFARLREGADCRRMRSYSALVGGADAGMMKPMSLAKGQLNGISARCVLLCPQRHGPDSELLEALNRPDLALIRTDNVYVALAELCAAARREVRAMNAGERSEGLILLLSHPTKLSDPAALVRTAERYAPHASIWLFDPAGSPRLRAVRVADVEGWASLSEARPPTNRAVSTPVVSRGQSANSAGNRAADQLSAESRTRKVALGSQDGKDRQAGGLLSSEELAMLLAIDPLGGDNDDDRPS